MKKRYLFIIIPVAVLAGLYLFLGGKPAESAKDIIVDVKKGEFRIEVTTTGELEARNSVRIMGPMGLRGARIWQVKIDKLVPEGTVVKKGDFIASLDKSELSDRINNSQTELDQDFSSFTQTKLDTAINLRRLRDDLVNKQYAVEERKLILEQSQYEPPATIKQNELNLEKSIREYEQAQVNYQLEEQKAVEQVKKAWSEYLESKSEVDFLQNLMNQMTIMAPEAGMVIYTRDHNGSRLGEGAMISTWEPTVATLPDLTKMISKTYVNEVDIRQIKKGQAVHIGLDAFPEKKLTGEVLNVANVGEQKANSDAKVFEVTIGINETDTTLRPAMTTSNTIVAQVIKDVLFVPLESLHSQGDTLTYVFKKAGLGITRQEVRIGSNNANEAVVLAGLTEEDKVLLSLPENPADKKLVLLEPTEQITSVK